MFPWLRIGGVTVPIFYLVQSLNLCLLFWWTFRRASTSGRSPRRAIDLVMIVAVAGLVGGRLLHVLWEAPEYYQGNPWRIFDVGSGGFVYFGGLFAGAAAGWFALKWTNEKPAPWFDFFAPVLSLGTAIGRVGCFFAGCCYGRVCDLPWAVKIVDENGVSLARHPAPLYAVIWELGVLAILIGLEKNPERRPAFLKKPGASFALWAALHSIGRFLIEFIRDDFRGPQLIGLTLGQFLSVGILLVSLVWIVRAPEAK